MAQPQVLPFDTGAACAAQFRACLAASTATLDLFDPDCAVFPLGAPDVDAALRGFLANAGVLRLVVHATSHVERQYPRFLRLLRDYGHLAECRVTPRALRRLTDSFCIGDGVHIVRRFHSDHMRGEAAFDAPAATDVSRQRFSAIWEEALPALRQDLSGL